MNRKVLANIFVSNGHSYANDALQGICTEIYNFDPYVILNAPRELPWSVEVKEHCRNQEQMIKLFDKIVSKGKDFALLFIKNNWSLYTHMDYTE
jgi:hypothetical protein